MENQDFGKSYVVLYKIGDAALPIPLSLSLAVALDGLGVRLPVGLLIIGVLGLPLLPAVLDHLRVQGVGPDLLPMVFGAATPLALRLAADTLLKAVRGRLKSALTIRAAAGLEQSDSSEVKTELTSEQNRYATLVV